MSILHIDTSGDAGVVLWQEREEAHERHFALVADVGRQVLAAAAELTGVRGLPAAVAVCVGPGKRGGALRAGVAAANALAWGWRVPIIAVGPGEIPAATSPLPPGSVARPQYSETGAKNGRHFS